MKRRTPLSTLVGAVPGALPALIGWTASHGSIDRSGAALFAIVFCWQLPHFMAIAWLYREDYAKAGFPMLPVIDPDGRRAGKQAVYWAFAAGARQPRADVRRPRRAAPIWPSRSCSASRCSGSPSALRTTRNEATARALFLGSITYLPLLWIVMIANKLASDQLSVIDIMLSHDLPAVNATLNALSGILLAHRLHPDPAAPDRAAPQR